jgi:dihydroneopterin aldolase
MSDAEPSRSTPATIELRGLRLVGVVGVLPEERERAQPLEIDLDVTLDLSAAAHSDGLDDTVDYGALCALVESVVATDQPQLLERLSARIAEAVLGADDRIEVVEAVVRKLRPPVPQDLATSGVRVRLHRGTVR